MNAALLIDSLVRTLQVGSMYALMAIGLTLTFAVLKLPNFAHAELITIGAYAALVMSLFITSNPLIVMGVAFVVAPNPNETILSWVDSVFQRRAFDG
ncbi:MAG: hypothetical protein R3A10_15430 [Caldilineaceae bacterium]